MVSGEGRSGSWGWSWELGGELGSLWGDAADAFSGAVGLPHAGIRKQKPLGFAGGRDEEITAIDLYGVPIVPRWRTNITEKIGISLRVLRGFERI